MEPESGNYNVKTITCKSNNGLLCILRVSSWPHHFPGASSFRKARRRRQRSKSDGRSLSSVASDPVAVAIKLINILANDSYRPLDVCRAIATATGAIDVISDRDTFAGIVGIAA